MVKRSVQRGLSKRGGEAGAYSFWYVEPPGAARTKLADLFNILLDGIYLKRGFRERGW